MASGKETTQQKKWKKQSGTMGGTSSGLYGLGFIGALVYYIQQADDFWMVILGLLKACVWPAFLVYELLKFVAA